MVEHRTQFRSYDPDLDGTDDDLSKVRSAPYKFGRSNDDYVPEQAVPLFLSDPNGEPDPEEFIAPLRRGGIASLSSKVLISVLAASGLAMLFAWFTSDATRDAIMNARASMVAMVSPPPAQADAAQLTPPDIELKNAPPSSTPAPRAIASSAPAAPAAGPIVVASTTPSREEIANAYQSAMRGAAPAAASPQAAAPQATTPQDAAPQAAAPVAAAPPSAPTTTRHIDSGELATLMKRANDMLSMGDIPAARLLLERAADAQDASAALLLARTYDPQVLGNADVRNITPEPAKARAWYQKAAQYGSPEAQRRLAQLPN